MRYRMFEVFHPDRVIASVYDLDYEGLYSEGMRGIIYDVDDTLAPHGAHADEKIKLLFEKLHKIGFRVVLLSNNNYARVRSFKEEVIYCDYIHRACKPSKTGYLKAMKSMGTDKANTLCIGDTIWTDIWGSNRCGIRSILVTCVK